MRTDLQIDKRDFGPFVEMFGNSGPIFLEAASKPPPT